MTEGEMSILDLAVAKAEGLRTDSLRGPRIKTFITEDGGESWRVFSPTRDPVEAMRLLEKHRLSMRPTARGLSGHPHKWCSYKFYTPAGADHMIQERGFGETPCIAICRVVDALAANRKRA